MLPMGGVWEGARETNEFIPTQAMSGEGKQYDGKMSRQITTFFFFSSDCILFWSSHEIDKILKIVVPGHASISRGGHENIGSH